MIKKIIIFILFTIISIGILLISNYQVQATFSDNNSGSYKELSIIRSSNTSYTTHATYLAETTNNSTISKQQVNVFVQEQTKNSKVVTWAISNKNGFVRTNIAGIAENYENSHPGWKVVGAINADQYYQYSGDNGTQNGSDYFYPQPYYPMIADGESWFSITVTPYGVQNVAGFLQDGSDDPIVSGSANWNGGSIKLSGFYLSVYDNDTMIGKFPLTDLNTSPKGGETTIWAPYTKKVFNDLVFDDLHVFPTSYLVYADNAYVSNSIDYVYKQGNNNQNAFFGKGEVVKVGEDITLSKGQFAIQTYSDELKEVLKIGNKVIAQYEFSGTLGNVEAAIGYHTIQRMDNQDIPSDASYNTNQYPRSLFGRTSDGKIVLITVDGKHPEKGFCGTSHNETNAILKHYGCVEAYQMDGGGSVSAVVKENGKFVFTNNPSDGGARNVLSALLLVEKEEDIKINNLVDLYNQAVLIIKRKYNFRAW